MFETDDWRVVALHHAGTSNTEQLETGTYTNEGVSIRAIEQATRERSAAGYGPAVRRRADEMSLPEKLPRARFYFALEGEAARGIFVRYGTDVDLIFNYAPPPADAAAVLSASDLDRVRGSQSPLGIMVAPIGLTFRGQSDSGYGQMHFYQGGTVSDEVRLELHAMDEPVPGQPVEGSQAAEALSTPLTTGLHVIFDLRGCMLYQFFLPEQLVRTLPELGGGVQAALLTFDLDQLRQFDEHAAEAQVRMAAALREVLS